MQLWWACATWRRMELQFHPTPGSTRSSQLHKMYQSRGTAKNSWWLAEGLRETCRVVIQIKLEFGASVSFIHKETEICLDTHKLRSWLYDEHFNRGSFLCLEINLDIQEVPCSIVYCENDFLTDGLHSPPTLYRKLLGLCLKITSILRFRSM